MKLCGLDQSRRSATFSFQQFLGIVLSINLSPRQCWQAWQLRMRGVSDWIWFFCVWWRQLGLLQRFSSIIQITCMDRELFHILNNEIKTFCNIIIWLLWVCYLWWILCINVINGVFYTGQGCLVQLFTGPNPMKGRSAFDDFGFSKELTKARMKLYPLNLLHELSVFAKSKVWLWWTPFTGSTQQAAGCLEF